MRSFYWAPLALGLALGQAASAQNLIKNGDFETFYVKNTTTPSTADSAWLGPNDLANWTTNSGLAMVYTPGVGDDPNSAAAKASVNMFAGGTYLAGPDGGWNNGLTPTSPAGGNYIAADGNFVSGSFWQTVNLVKGQTYTLSFWYAGAQLNAGAVNGNGVAQTAGWYVQLDDAATGISAFTPKTFMTPSFSEGSFSPWTQAVITFTANAASEKLYMSPTGTGAPPMALLDGVTILQGANVVPAVPEPANWGLLLVGGAVVMRLRQRRQAAAAQ